LLLSDASGGGYFERCIMNETKDEARQRIMKETYCNDCDSYTCDCRLRAELAAVKAERDKLNTKIKQYKDALELAVRYNRKGELLNKLALALESDGE